jgi:hypothetical protein
LPEVSSTTSIASLEVVTNGAMLSDWFVFLASTHDTGSPAGKLFSGKRTFLERRHAVITKPPYLTTRCAEIDRGNCDHGTHARIQLIGNVSAGHC